MIAEITLELNPLIWQHFFYRVEEKEQQFIKRISGIFSDS